MVSPVPIALISAGTASAFVAGCALQEKSELSSENATFINSSVNVSEPASVTTLTKIVLVSGLPLGFLPPIVSMFSMPYSFALSANSIEYTLGTTWIVFSISMTSPSCSAVILILAKPLFFAVIFANGPYCSRVITSVAPSISNFTSTSSSISEFAT